jgi:hypothetical protein
MTTCQHCQRQIVPTEDGWADPLATGDDSVWRFSCDNNDTFTAQHAPTLQQLSNNDTGK